MARSLTITQEEQATTNPLLTGFLLLAIAFMGLGSIVWGVDEARAVQDMTAIELVP